MRTSGYRIEVKRHATRTPSFTWLLYFAGNLAPVKASQRIFANEAAARSGGEAALKEFLRLTRNG